MNIEERQRRIRVLEKLAPLQSSINQCVRQAAADGVLVALNVRSDPETLVAAPFLDISVFHAPEVL